MSELKVINAYRLTTNTEDSDVCIHNDEFCCGGDLVECYLKSEVDKVIDELKAKLKVQTSNAEEAWKLKDSYHTDYSEAVEELFKKNKQLRHNKYKRCLSMADFCESQHDYYNTLGNGFWLVRGDKEKRDEYRKKASDFWWKYHKRWLELAEKFKEAK